MASEDEPANWTILERLRSEFLNAKGDVGVYWKSEADLAHYHRFFAARIGWKWDDAIAQAQQAGWRRQSHRILDWGCGSGIATLRMLDAIGADGIDGIDGIDEVILWDYSTLTCNFARNAIESAYPNLSVRIAAPETLGSLDDTLCLASHVLNELDIESRSRLTRLFSQANQVFWVEPGSYDSSRLLVEAREALLDRFSPIAPCVCDQPCPMNTEENARHWCHFFAKTPVEAFTQTDWSRFATIMEIDLRSLPYSFICLDARKIAATRSTEEASRIIGRPRQHKGYTRIFSCDVNGLNDYELQKRDNKSLWKSIKKGKDGSLYQWTRVESGRIQSGQPFD